MKTSLFLLTTVLVAAFTSPFRITETQAAGTSDAMVAAAKFNSFSFLRTHRQAKGVTATWGMTSADEVLDFTIQRTYEDPADPYAYWENIATVASTSARSFTYTDKEVFPGTIHYRIVAILTDGSTVQSEISSIRIVSRH
jgi:hypothetical protein